MVKLKIPGKLYLAGEYAVLYPNNPAILFTLNRFMHVSLEFRENDGLIQDNSFPPLVWTRDHLVYTHQSEDYFDIMFASIRITDQYLTQLNIALNYYSIHVQTDLKDQGVKLGLGSSAAISVGLIKGILKLYELPYTNELIYKLAVLAHLDCQMEGSFGDIAACAYTGLIAYTAVDKVWLKEQLMSHDLLSIISLEWPLLHIESLPVLDFLTYKIGWTKTSASTQDLVKQLKTVPLSDEFVNTFRKENKYHVEQLITSIKTKDFSLFRNHLSEVRRLLQQLQQASNINIETSSLVTLITLAHEAGGVAKSSGAGGGDCGIAFFEDDEFHNHISEIWEQAGIKDLHLKIYQEDQDVT